MPALHVNALAQPWGSIILTLGPQANPAVCAIVRLKLAVLLFGLQVRQYLVEDRRPYLEAVKEGFGL